MGIVYRVINRATGVECVLKRTLPLEGARASVAAAAFEREYRVLASLEHPRIIRVFEYGVDADGPYYTMELLRGPDLQPATPWRQVCLQLRDIATSLSLLHARRLIHRDLSPRNVKTTPDGHCKLLDFGALVDFGTTTGIVGTPPLVPPEALRGAALDQRYDLYALGALGYWLLTGEHAFPARCLDDLELLWERPARAPSSLVAGIPKALDALILALLSANPLARPGSAAEVIARLNTIGQLPLEDEAERKRLAASFLIVPPFVGRDSELARLEGDIDSARRGEGRAVRVEASAGTGRSRLLEEVGLRSQTAGATVLRADASMHPTHLGTARALVGRLLDALPDLALACARSSRCGSAFAALGREFEERIGVTPSRPVFGSVPGESPATLDDWMIEISRHKPLVIEVDNLEFCDDASLGLLVSLARRAPREALLIVVAERIGSERTANKGSSLLRSLCKTLALQNLSPDETLSLARSLFGDAPNVERFAEWMYGRTAGSPLHIVEISRQLVVQDIVRHEAGMWVLPASRPQVELPDALEDALMFRLRVLSPSALALAQSLSLQRIAPTIALCSLLANERISLVDGQPSSAAETLLDELAEADVMVREQDVYRFTSAALREALLAAMTDEARKSSHRRLGRAFATLATDADLPLRIEAGWHFMQGGDELRGAEMVARVMCHGWAINQLSSNNYPIGPVSAAALEIFTRHRKSGYERLPLLAALAQAGFFEELRYCDRYADEAIALMDELSGIRLARRLRGMLGARLGLVVGLLVALVRFVCAPKRERTYSFEDLLHQTFGTVTGIVAASTISLDADRAERFTSVLSPFAALPERETPRGIYSYCLWNAALVRERPAEAFAAQDALCRHFQDLRWYRQLPAAGRGMYIMGAHFSRGAFAVFRASSAGALEDAEALEASGLTMNAMVASQLRFLYHTNRGELALAKPHRQRVEDHAAHVGSAWQVELWEDAALLPFYISAGDVVEVTRVVRRFDELMRIAPALSFYGRLANFALLLVSNELTDANIAAVLHEVDNRPPRSFIGWSVVLAALASAHNACGRHAEARALCERALATITDEDREYVMLFLQADLQMAHAEAGLGAVDAALARLDGLLARFASSEHPMTLGLLHESRAQIAHRADRTSERDESLDQCEHWLRGTGTPALIAKYERLEAFCRASDTLSPRPIPRQVLRDGETPESVSNLETEISKA